MHVVILGGSGFVGRRLKSRFDCLSDWHVESLGSRECDLTRPEAVDFLRARIRQDSYVLFCSTISRLRDDSLDAFHRNVAMAENVAKAAAHGFGHLTFLSSIDVYGRPPVEPVLGAASPISPAGYYGLAKFVSERLLLAELGNVGPVAVFRLPGVYSLDGADTSVLGRLYASLTRHAPVYLNGGGRQVRSYLHIDELDEILRQAFQRKWSGLLTLASARSLSIRDAVLTMREHLGSTSEMVDTPADGSEFDIRIDMEPLLRTFPDFRPRTLAEFLGSRSTQHSDRLAVPGKPA